jgi:polyamine oxidase
VVREVSYSPSGVTVKTEDKSVYTADYVMVSASLVSCKVILFSSSHSFLSVPTSSCPISFHNGALTSIHQFLSLHCLMFSLHSISIYQPWKVLAIYQLDMAVYTKIFVKFPKKFWPEGKGREFFLYASSRKGSYV